MKTRYPDDCPQSTISPWWIDVPKFPVRRGHLAWAWVPHFTQTPFTLIPESRAGATKHSRVALKIEAVRAGQGPKLTGPPIAALPLHPGEHFTVFRGKYRPVLVLSSRPAELPDAPATVLVAPYYDGVRSAIHTGFSEELARRIRHCEFPQYLWDILPVEGSAFSILRLDQLQPLADHPDVLDPTPHALSSDALALLDEWLSWLLTGRLPAGEHDLLALLRSTLLASE